MDNQNGKDLVLAALRHEDTPRLPWIPFAGVHAGKLVGYNAREVLTNSDKLVEALLAVNKQYLPDGQPVVFDLQVEAEILGCKLIWADNAPPSVASHPLEGTLDIPTYLPQATDGRLPIILEATRRIKPEVGEHTALYGLVTGPFTLASHLRGTDIFLDSIDNPDYLLELIVYTTQVCKRIIDFYLEVGMDVIALVDPLVSQVSPRHFKQFLVGSFSDFFVCGDATKNIEVMCHTGPDCIAVDENIDMTTAKLITDEHNITLSGNIPLTSVMLFGTQQDNMLYVLNLMDSLTHKNLMISPGCDMPYDTPVENPVGIMQTVREPEVARKMLVNYRAAEMDIQVDLPDYANLKKPLIEVFTLDSETCAACAYMYIAGKKVADEFAGKVDFAEYRITVLENIARIKKLGVKNLPSIYVNGELKFSSIIPGHRELIDVVKQYLK
jgi:uroporphyrinogen decarboxylase